MSRIDNVTYSLFCNLPSQMLVQSICNFFTVGSKTIKFNDIFAGNVFPYRKTDDQANILPSINVYLLNTATLGDMGYYTGTIRIEFSLPASLFRERITEASVVIGDGFMLITRHPLWIEYMRNNVPGLLELGVSANINYQKIFNTNQDALVVIAELNFKLSWNGYYQYLNENGLDPLDPCIQALKVTSYNLNNKLIGEKDANHK